MLHPCGLGVVCQPHCAIVPRGTEGIFNGVSGDAVATLYTPIMRGRHTERVAQVFVLLLTAAGAQAQLDPLSASTPPRPVPYQAYDNPESVNLSEIAYGGQRFHRTTVRTKGSLNASPNGSYYILSEGTARVLLIPVPEIEHESRSFVGRRIEITGLARVLPAHQEMQRCYGERLPESKCADYELPVLPNARIDWPEVSITYFTLTDIEPFPGKGTDAEGLNLAELAASIGKTVRVVGLFGGRNLLGDLPAGSEQGPSDWVLRRGGDAVWVTGKQPRGSGWRLDPSYPGDTVRWLQVTGRVEKRGEITYIRASNVALAEAPKKADEER
jgi:hypothetical protein